MSFCAVCGAPRHPAAQLCKACKKFRDRLDVRAKRRGSKTDETALQQAMVASWDSSVRVFICYYSGVVLDRDPKSPWHATFDHRTPREENDIVVCAALVNDMKSDLTEAEFHRVVRQLSEKFASARAAIDRTHLKHWKRA